MTDNQNAPQQTTRADADLLADIEWAQRGVDDARQELRDAEELLETLKRLRSLCQVENQHGQ